MLFLGTPVATEPQPVQVSHSQGFMAPPPPVEPEPQPSKAHLRAESPKRDMSIQAGMFHLPIQVTLRDLRNCTNIKMHVFCIFTSQIGPTFYIG